MGSVRILVTKMWAHALCAHVSMGRIRIVDMYLWAWPALCGHNAHVSMVTFHFCPRFHGQAGQYKRGSQSAWGQSGSVKHSETTVGLCQQTPHSTFKSWQFFKGDYLSHLGFLALLLQITLWVKHLDIWKYFTPSSTLHLEVYGDQKSMLGF